MSTTWEDVEVPVGTFIGWSAKPGQVITLKVHDYSPQGGTDFNENPCPRVVGELTVAATTYKDKGATAVELDAGEMVTINAGQANLARNIRAADPAAGDLLRITFHDLEKGTKGDIKVFKCQIQRGAGRTQTDGDLI